MKAESAERLPARSMSRGKVACRYNYTETIRDNDTGPATIIGFDYVLIDLPLARSAIIDAIISDRYAKSAEIAMINNKELSEDDAAEYADYQAYRLKAKLWADQILADQAVL